MSDVPEYPLVTFALIAYNQEQYIREALESALTQDYPNLEILISDDRSTDDTFKIASACLAEYRGPHRTELVLNSVNMGLAGHINELLLRARGDFVCWAAGDDVSLPGKVRALAAPLLDSDLVMGTHSYVNEIDASGRFLMLRKPSVPDVIDSAKQVVDDNLEVISQSHMFRRSVWEKFGPLDLAVTNESAVMAFREACCGKIVLVPAALTNYRVGVGVSTQRGSTVYDLSISGPVKYARWWATGFRQIRSDLHRCSSAEGLSAAVENKVRYFDARLRINEKSWQVGALFSQAMRPGFFSLVKAFVRRNSPKMVLRFLYRRAGWLQ